MSYTEESFKNKRCTVLGLGISNLPLIDFLLGCGAIVEARDKKRGEEIPEVYDKMTSLGIKFVGGEGYLDNIEADYVFRSPGIRPDHSGILSAISSGAVLLSEMELFIDMCPCPIIAITGSDGKTTTSTLTAKLIEQTGKRVYLGGNIGTPLLSKYKEMRCDDVVVLELSSFQLMTMKKSPMVSAITNISPNHLDWHVGMDEYIDAKANIFKNSENQKLILNKANYVSEKYSKIANSKVEYFSAKVDADYTLLNGYITYHGEKILAVDDILLPGIHNVENYMTAIALTCDFGVSKEHIYKVASTFPGVEHRLEFVRTFNGVKYFNSSIDSSPSRTAAALSALNCNAIVICGGYDKNIPFDALAEALIKYSKAVILTGATADKIYRTLQDYNAKLPIYTVDDFDKAVHKAKDIAVTGDTVVLSPACASFDKFKNFEVRGRYFKNIVNSF